MPLVLSGTNGISANGTNIGITVDTNGRVLRPNQVAFWVTNTGGFTVSGGATVTYNSARFNIGTCVALATGIFTAPVAGYYYFAFQAVIINRTSYVWGGLSLNGASALVEWHTTSAATDYESKCISTTLYLNANDNVRMVPSGGTATLQASRFSFSGFLIG